LYYVIVLYYIIYIQGMADEFEAIKALDKIYAKTDRFVYVWIFS